VIPILRWDKIAQKGLRFAHLLSADVQALHVDCGEGSQRLREDWARFVEEPAKKAAVPAPKLVVLNSPYRFVINPILDYILELVFCPTTTLPEQARIGALFVLTEEKGSCIHADATERR
jgi:hypothetical protein